MNDGRESAEVPEFASAGITSLWAEAQIQPEASTGYFAVTMLGELYDGALIEAARAVLHRHPPLRTILRMRSGKLEQVTLDANTVLNFNSQQLPCPKGSESDLARQWVDRELSKQPWDLTWDAPIRFVFLRHDYRRGTMIFHVHHVGFDGRSKYIVARDFGTYLHDAISVGKACPVALTRTTSSEADEQVVEQAVEYWRKLTAGMVQPLSLPIGRTPEGRGIASTPTIELEVAHMKAIRALCRRRGESTFTGLVAALGVQLREYGNERIFFSVAADVSDEHSRHVAGMQINVVPVALDMTGVNSAADALLAASRSLRIMSEFRRVPFNTLITRIGDRVAGRLMTQFGVSFPRSLPDVRLDIPGLEVRWEFFTPNTSTTFTNTLHIRADWPKCLVRFDYRQEMMSPKRAEQFVAAFQSAVSLISESRNIIAKPMGASVSGKMDRSAATPYFRSGVHLGWLAQSSDVRDPPLLYGLPGSTMAALGPDRTSLQEGIGGDLAITCESGETIETGDVGFVEDENIVRVLGPKGGQWFLRQGIIDGPLIERVCNAHPLVDAAKVAQDREGNGPVILTVRVKSKVVPPTPRSIRSYLRLQLPGRDLPGQIEVVVSDV